MSAEVSASFLAITFLLGTIVVCTIIGNLFVIIAIVVDKNLQTPANQLVLSLACSDLMVACLVMPLGAYNDVNQGWYLGKEVCEFWTSADVLCCTASILHLLAIALDRYWAVTNADYIYRRTRTRMHTMIVCAWTVGLIVSLAPIFGWKDPDFAQRVLEEHKCLVSQDVAYQLFATISSFYAPLVLLLALYWRIFQVALKRIRRKPGAAKALATSAQSKQPQEIVVHRTSSRSHQNNQQQQVPAIASEGWDNSPARQKAGDKQPASGGQVIEQVKLDELDANQLALTLDAQTVRQNSDLQHKGKEAMASEQLAQVRSTCGEIKSNGLGPSFGTSLKLDDDDADDLGPLGGSQLVKRASHSLGRRRRHTELLLGPKQTVSNDNGKGWRRQWRRLSEVMGAALRIDAGAGSWRTAAQANPMLADPADREFEWETSGLEARLASCRRGWRLKRRRRVVVPVQGAANANANANANATPSAAETVTNADNDAVDSGADSCTSNEDDRHCSHVVTLSGKRESRGSTCECQHCLRLHSTGAAGDQLPVIETAGGTCCDCYYSCCCAASASGPGNSAAAIAHMAANTCSQCAANLSEQTAVEINHASAGHAYLAVNAVIDQASGQQDKRHFGLDPAESGPARFSGSGGGHKIDEPRVGRTGQNWRPNGDEELIHSRAPSDAKRRQSSGEELDGEEDNASEASSLSGPFPPPLASLRRQQQQRRESLVGERGTRDTCNKRQQSSESAFYDRLSGTCPSLVPAACCQLARRRNGPAQGATLTLCALNSIAQPEMEAAQQQPALSSQGGRSLGLKRKFKALGQLVSFVQTSRNLNSTCSSSSGAGACADWRVSGAGSSSNAAAGQSSSMSGEVEEEEASGCLEDEDLPAESEGTSRTEAMQEDTQVASSTNQTQQTVISDGCNEQADLARRRSTLVQAPHETKSRKSLALSTDKQVHDATRRVSTRCARATILANHQRHQQPAMQQHQASPLAPPTVRGRRENMEIKREKKAAKTLAIITGVFVCCWLPFFLNAIVMPVCGPNCTPSDLILSILLWLGYLNSLLNPIIYTIFSPDFRRAFRRLLCWPSHAAASHHAHKAKVLAGKKVPS